LLVLKIHISVTSQWLRTKQGGVSNPGRYANFLFIHNRYTDVTVNHKPGQVEPFLKAAGAWSYHSPPSCAQFKKSSSRITLRTTGFLGLVHRLIFWTEHNVSTTGSVSVFRWKVGGATYSVPSVKKVNGLCCLLLPMPPLRPCTKKGDSY
jgi:hypothetical protein